MGEIAEHVACGYLESKGYKIIERNYTKKWGELDIIALKDKGIHFVEVKSKSGVPDPAVSDAYRPEDNMHPWKVKRLLRTIQTYLLERDIKGEWQFDLAVVYLSLDTKEARVKILENVIL